MKLYYNDSIGYHFGYEPGDAAVIRTFNCNIYVERWALDNEGNEEIEYIYTLGSTNEEREMFFDSRNVSPFYMKSISIPKEEYDRLLYVLK